MANDNLGDLEVIASKIKEIASKIKTDSNPEQLDDLKRLIKKNVPFTLRGYFSAYLLRQLLTLESSDKSVNRRADSFKKKSFDFKEKDQKSNFVKPLPKKDADFKPSKKENETFKTPAAKAPQQPRPERTERPARKEYEFKDGKTLYLNIGKIKRLYAKDLSKLLQTELGISREEIYALRIHDKYSFITMSEENCNKAIEILNGKEINGRIAQINYSNRGQAKETVATTETVEVKAEPKLVPEVEPVIEAQKEVKAEDDGIKVEVEVIKPTTLSQEATN